MSFPNHIAIIPDGNRRWAKKRHLLPWHGHKHGAERFREIATYALKANIPYLTFWAASEDNLTKRNKAEVKFLTLLLKNFLKKELENKTFIKNKIRIRIIGRWRELLKDKNLENLIKELEKATSEGRKNLTILFGYDGRQEMLSAIKKGGINFEKYLLTADLPPVDFVIRTGGEPHWSAGFMMWRTADSQFYFTKTLWPDFNKNHFKKSLADFSKRARRFGS